MTISYSDRTAARIEIVSSNEDLNGFRGNKLMGAIGGRLSKEITPAVQ